MDSPRLLILGSKEYPVGSGKGHDRLAAGGMEVYAQELAAELGQMGIAATILTRRFPGQKPSEQHGSVRIERVGWLPGFLLRNLSFNLAAALRALNIPHEVVISNGFVATLLATLLRPFTHAPVIARPAGVAWVQPQYSVPLNKLLRSLERLAYRRADVVVFPTREEMDQFKNKLGFLPQRVSLIPTGVRVDVVPASRVSSLRKHYSKGKSLVVFVGRLIEVKGISYLLQAASGIDATILLVGGGPSKAGIEAQITAKSIPNISLAGEKSPHEVRELLAAADVFVLPSLSEGLPLSLLEAMAAGKPCVVTDIGLPVQDGKTALVVPPKDPAALAKAINRLLKDKNLRKRIGESAKRHVLEGFSWQRAADAYVKLANSMV